MSASPLDVGLYQCVAANSEGVVFSRVVKVKQIPSRSSATDTRGEGRALIFTNVFYVNPQEKQEEESQEYSNLFIVTPRASV